MATCSFHFLAFASPAHRGETTVLLRRKWSACLLFAQLRTCVLLPDEPFVHLEPICDGVFALISIFLSLLSRALLLMSVAQVLAYC